MNGDAVSPIEKFVYDAICNGPPSGMTTEEIRMTQNGATSYTGNAIRQHGINMLQARGKIAAIGSRVVPAASGKKAIRLIVWLDSGRVEKPSIQQNQNASESIAVRQALTDYIREAIINEDDQDPEWIARWLARLLVRDWDIKPR